MYLSFLDSIVDLAVKQLNSDFITRIHLSRKGRAIALVLAVLLTSFIAGVVATFTSHAYLPLALLGILYGTILSYPATKLLGPKLQAALGGLLGGLTLGNVSSKVASFRSAILTLSKSITALVKGLGGVFADSTKAPYLEAAIVYCIWMSLITVFLIVAVNAYMEQGLNASQNTPTPPSGNSTQSAVSGK